MKPIEFQEMLVNELNPDYLRQLAQRALDIHGLQDDQDLSEDVGLLLETVLRLIQRDWSEMLPD